MSFDKNIHEGPMEVVKTMLEGHGWEFDTINGNQVVFSVGGQWADYSFTIVWGTDEILRLICTFPLAVAPDHVPALYDLLNRCNDIVWTGAFTWWSNQSLLVWRYGLILNSVPTVSSDQVEQVVYAALSACERFYPAFQVVASGKDAPEKALKMSCLQSFGRA